ncbi:MAG TPA: rod shape-determining protein MreC [Polyangiaceae bacterium]|nr:MAG: Cell shape-determining protein MreC [Deltaproteobacteria bacterium ADurb.Bin207]HNS96881.1 rod shape-determining protein MreC [Polyangiaceae bacterium]HNZ24418.1 rod shape-determining protein MreC [Polyangiaceae bacterium]HOD22482.1 rod shape-determining protein MreC [Polyangiaceae bacterium]HOE49210.1 rod shape-determining protein MreC [Polyangiaceae bacterium]
MNSLRRYRDAIIVVILLAVPFFFLRANVRDPRELNPLDRAIITISAPFQYVASMLARGISTIVGDYIYLVDVKADNQKLAYENARLHARVRHLEHLEVDNARLKKLLELKNTLPADLVSAHVVSKDTTEYFRVARVSLDRSARNIRPNMPVLALDGVVGTVHRVAGDTIDVLLTVDSGSGIDVVVERTGARGIVRGTGDRSRYACRVEYVQRTDEVAVGDLLLTSGVGKRFPKGLPVARVTEVTRRDFGIYQTVEAVPAVDLSRLDYVLIVTSMESDKGTDAP